MSANEPVANGIAQPAPDASVTPPDVSPATAPTAPAAPDLEALRSQIRAEVLAEVRPEFETLRKQMQSKSDRAYAAALRDAKVVDEIAALTGMKPEQAAQAKKAITDKRFEQAFQEEPAPVTSPAEKVWSAQDLQQFALAQYGLSPQDFDVSPWANLTNSDPRGGSFYAEAAKALKRKQEAKPGAAAIAKTREEFGTTGSTGAPAGVPAQNPLEGINDSSQLYKMAWDEWVKKTH